MKPPVSFKKHLERIAGSSGYRSDQVFPIFCKLAACALSARAREAEYMEEIGHWKKDEQMGFGDALAALVQEMEAKPFTDLLGPLYMEMVSQWGKSFRGEFYTPAEVSELCARMIHPKPGKTNKSFTLLEPACGSGGMILATAKQYVPNVYRLRVTAIDISPLACDMTFINTTLWGIPCRVLHGNYLSEQVWRSYPNIHWRLCGQDIKAITKKW